MVLVFHFLSMLCSFLNLHWMYQKKDEILIEFLEGMSSLWRNSFLNIALGPAVGDGSPCLTLTVLYLWVPFMFLLEGEGRKVYSGRSLGMVMAGGGRILIWSDRTASKPLHTLHHLIVHTALAWGPIAPHEHPTHLTSILRYGDGRMPPPVFTMPRGRRLGKYTWSWLPQGMSSVCCGRRCCSLVTDFDLLFYPLDLQYVMSQDLCRERMSSWPVW